MPDTRNVRGTHDLAQHVSGRHQVGGGGVPAFYRLPSRLLAANAIGRYSIGDRTPDIAYAEDDSLEIALQLAEPTDPVRRANWLPTPAGEPFTVIYRLYGPGEDAQAGAWSLPPIRPAS